MLGFRVWWSNTTQFLCPHGTKTKKPNTNVCSSLLLCSKSAWAKASQRFLAALAKFGLFLSGYCCTDSMLHPGEGGCGKIETSHKRRGLDSAKGLPRKPQNPPGLNAQILRHEPLTPNPTVDGQNYKEYTIIPIV